MESVGRRDMSKKREFLKGYMKASNAASGSKYDSNANVTNKNISTASCEVMKKDMIDLHREIVVEYLSEEDIELYWGDLRNHLIYPHDESSIFPYCCSISLYPFILNGTRDIGGNSIAPKSANSFIGGLINLVYMVASQFAGAVAIPEFLCYFDHYLRTDYGDDYMEHLDEEVEKFHTKRVTMGGKLNDWFQQFVYSINAPAGARNYQSPFTNIAYFDKNYFESIFENFIFPDGDVPNWESTSKLQKYYMKWFNKEREREVLTFPVETANLLCIDGEYKDEDTADFMAEMWSEGHSFFMYQSDSVDALASCCFWEKQQIKVRYTDARQKEYEYEGRIGNLKDELNKNGATALYAYYNGKWKRCHLISLPNRPMYRVVTETGEEIVVSDNHLNPTLRGDIVTTGLTTEDKLKISYNFVTNGEYTENEVKYVKIASIEPEIYDGYIYCLEMEDKIYPYFTLANGIITHNCRLRNAVEENVFSYTLGAGGIQTGSKNVITLNLNRIVQKWYREGMTESLSDCIRGYTKRVHRYLNAWNKWLWDCYNDGALPVYSAGFIDLDKQYLTVGVNGFVEVAEFLSRHNVNGYEGIKANPYNEQYKKLSRDILGTIKQCNTEDRTEHCRYNTEFVPGENAAAKLYAWDKEDGYEVPEGRNLYNSYFFAVEDTHISPVDKFYYQGNGFATECDGGVANHINLDSFLSKEQYKKMMVIAAKAGCNYFTYNIPSTCCNNPDCGHIDKRYLKKCPVCGSTDVDYATRIIGYLKRVSNFSEPRQEEANRRYYATTGSFITSLETE